MLPILPPPLFDKGHVDHRYVDNVGFIQQYERHTRIKIFKKEAYSLADVAFIYYTWQKIGDLKATCYNEENGKIWWPTARTGNAKSGGCMIFCKPTPVIFL